MGRSGASRRSKKAEKAKVKLKGHATKFLPKGKNITNTTFKVRKIVLQEQLKTPDLNQPLSRKKLNVKEVLSRLQHYNSSQREDGLVGLSELLTQMDMTQLTSHLSSIVDSLGRLSLDGESKVRRRSAEILTSLFATVGETQVLPFCAILGSYLSCAMTHIQRGIQEDSLFLLDALLLNTPALVASSANQLLPCVLDMISHTRGDSQTTRQLSVNLTSNLTSLTWTARVLGRLQALLSVSLQHRTGGIKEMTANKAHHLSVLVTFKPDEHYNFPLYSQRYSTPLCLNSIFSRSHQNSKLLLDDASQLRSFAESLMPLLFDCWVEVNPPSAKKSHFKSADSGLSLESAVILHGLLESVNLLWQHLVLWDKEKAQDDLTNWFKATFLKDINKILVKGFPYSARECFEDNDEVKSQGTGRKRNQSSVTNSESNLLQLALPFFLKDKNEQLGTQAIEKCVPQNLTMCHLLVNLVKTPQKEAIGKIMDFLITCLNKWGGSLMPWSEHLLRALSSVFDKSSAWAVDLDPLLSAVVRRFHRSGTKLSASHRLLGSQLCRLLGDISLSSNCEHLQRCESFNLWIHQLPTTLNNEDVSLDTLCMLNKLASQNNLAFLQGLQNTFASLLSAVKNFRVGENENVAEKEAGLASLFYWITEWTDEHVASLKDTLMNNQCSASLVKKILLILSLRMEKFEALVNADWLIISN